MVFHVPTTWEALGAEILGAITPNLFTWQQVSWTRELKIFRLLPTLHLAARKAATAT